MLLMEWRKKELTVGVVVFALWGALQVAASLFLLRGRLASFLLAYLAVVVAVDVVLKVGVGFYLGFSLARLRARYGEVAVHILAVAVASAVATTVFSLALLPSEGMVSWVVSQVLGYVIDAVLWMFGLAAGFAGVWWALRRLEGAEVSKPVELPERQELAGTAAPQQDERAQPKRRNARRKIAKRAKK